MKKSIFKAFFSISIVRRFLQSKLLAPFNQVAEWNRLAQWLNPVWSLSEVRARVVRVLDETPGVKSIWLKPNRIFRGFSAGQHVLLTLEIDGAKHSRCFSFSLAPRADGLIRLTIKQNSNAIVSKSAHQLSPGDVVTLSQAQGQFSPRRSNRSVLMICAGSGVTPMMSLLKNIIAKGSTHSYVLLYSVRTIDDFIFAEELASLSACWPTLKIILHQSTKSGRLDAKQISQYVPDWNTRETLLCGPDGLMYTIEEMYKHGACSDLLQSENFGRRAAPIDPDAHFYAVKQGEQSFQVQAGQAILVGAESAGLSPRFGCRRGICRTCQCKKLTGTVINSLTGQHSGAGEEWIQLCVSTPQSAIELAT